MKRFRTLIILLVIDLFCTFFYSVGIDLLISHPYFEIVREPPVFVYFFSQSIRDENLHKHHRNYVWWLDDGLSLEPRAIVKDGKVSSASGPAARSDDNRTEQKMVTEPGIEPRTYHYPGGCSSNWAIQTHLVSFVWSPNTAGS